MDPFVAEIRIVPFNFAPKAGLLRWAAHASVANTALFALLGTTYAATARAPSHCPTCKGRGRMHPGQGQGLSLRDLGEIGGTQSVTLLVSEMPVHSHA